MAYISKLTDFFPYLNVRSGEAHPGSIEDLRSRPPRVWPSSRGRSSTGREAPRGRCKKSLRWGNRNSFIIEKRFEWSCVEDVNTHHIPSVELIAVLTRYILDDFGRKKVLFSSKCAAQNHVKSFHTYYYSTFSFISLVHTCSFSMSHSQQIFVVLRLVQKW